MILKIMKKFAVVFGCFSITQKQYMEVGDRYVGDRKTLQCENTSTEAKKWRKRVVDSIHITDE